MTTEDSNLETVNLTLKQCKNIIDISDFVCDLCDIIEKTDYEIPAVLLTPLISYSSLVLKKDLEELLRPAREREFEAYMKSRECNGVEAEA